MAEFLTEYSLIIVAAISLSFSIIGIVARELRGEKDHKITSDAFTGGTIYSVFYLLVSLVLLDDAEALKALNEQKTMICLFTSAGLVLFTFNFFTSTVLGRENGR